MNRILKKTAVLGSGVMGSQIACHLANVGFEVLLLDLPGGESGTPDRNKTAAEALAKAIKMNPAPLHDLRFAERIRCGNFEDDLPQLKDVDWIVEAIVERIEPKQSLYERVEVFRKPGSLITTNTSGIPISLLSAGRSPDFAAHFCGTHFFNPPRYLRLFELIPGPHTQPEVLSFFEDFGARILGKEVVLAKDTPAFIANRIGVFSMVDLFHDLRTSGLSIEDVDGLTGTLMGRPKSATFRTCDVVGLDTLVHVARGLEQHCPNDEQHSRFVLPEYIGQMMAKNRLGSKTGAGFYRKNDRGDIEVLDLETLEYRPSVRKRFALVDKLKSTERILDRWALAIEGDDEAAAFFRRMLGGLFAYASHRIPEIAEEPIQIDRALKAGFGWEHGPFELWDRIGVQKGRQLAEALGRSVPEWILELERSGKGFYQLESEQLSGYVPQLRTYRPDAAAQGLIKLDWIRGSRTLWTNGDCSILDLGDGILDFEIHSKMNTLGASVLSGLHRALDLAEQQFRGLVIGNEGAHFSVGANLAMVLMMAAEEDWDELGFAVKYFQDTTMRLRYSAIPTVVAVHGMTFGGGCEMSLHADAVQAAAETYIGLVEFGVGLIPGGGGTKELTARASERYLKDDVELNALREYYLTIAMAKVATSAHEAFAHKLLLSGRDRVSINKDRLIADAKRKALLLAEEGYVQPAPKKIKVLGRTALGMFAAGSFAMLEGGYISEHDRLISQKLGWIMAGGDLSEPTEVSEAYLLELEREAFLSLCGERKTLERIQHMLKTGKPLRN
ncbi:3-hydroxyacyl-CoA dehydrogenase [bacterium]|nr:3-hydroxyacyl-CoA dehydrogenase [bacterium]